MINAIKVAIFNPQINAIHFRSSFFHSTPVLQRKRRNSWNPASRSSYHARRFRKLQSKQSLLRNVSAYADYIFEGMRDEYTDEDPASSKDTSWFRKNYSKGSRSEYTANQGSRRWGKKGVQFCEDEIEFEVENVFEGSRFFYWSFINEETPRRQNKSSKYYDNYGNPWRWRHRVEENYDGYSTETEDSVPDSTSDRLTLGLTSSGPLKLEDVKIAYWISEFNVATCALRYRTCALKWHPDRHQGSSKVVAEEKFKLCSSAYQSLCDKLTAA